MMPRSIKLLAAISFVAIIPLSHAKENTTFDKQVARQQNNNKAFRERLKGMSPEDRKTAAASHREAQLRENKALKQALYDNNKASLKKPKALRVESVSEAQLVGSIDQDVE